VLSLSFNVSSFSQLAKAGQVSAFVIFPNRAAYDMIVKLPRNLPTLLTCSGFGQAQCNRYGNQILEVVKQHLKKYNLAGNVVNASLPGTSFAKYMIVM
jgi:superfamily II DNA helicase RecQ